MTSPAQKSRALQLDGLRAISMIAICWDHWQHPLGWPRLFPYEVFLFFFLVMTGWLITGSLLRQREKGDATGKPWRMPAMRTYQIRRGLRILAPYYVAIAMAWLMAVPDMRHAFWWYATHTSNIHMATLPAWPHSVNHFWSLAMQQQFYLVWPFVIWFVPKRWLLPAILLVTAIGPLCRYHSEWFMPTFARPGVLTVSCLDYFGAGALLAYALHRGMSYESPALRWVSWACFVGYLVIFASCEKVFLIEKLSFLRPALPWVCLCAAFAAAFVSLRGPIGKVLATRQRTILLSTAWFALLGYIAIVANHARPPALENARFFQQTLLSLALCGFIASAYIGFCGPIGRFLETPVLQRIGLVSYGIYLFHNLAPYFTGLVVSLLKHTPAEAFFVMSGTHPAVDATIKLISILVHAAFTWLLASASWRWIEFPLQNMRQKFTKAA